MKLRAFSLAEAMIVMLIVSVALASMVPMLSKKAKSHVENGSNWLVSANGLVPKEERLVDYTKLKGHPGTTASLSQIVNYLFALLGENPASAADNNSPSETIPQALNKISGGVLQDLGTCKITYTLRSASYGAITRNNVERSFTGVTRQFCENLYINAIERHTEQTYTTCNKLGYDWNTGECELTGYRFIKD